MEPKDLYAEASVVCKEQNTGINFYSPINSFSGINLFRSLSLIFFFIIMGSVVANAQTTTFPSGSIIINMGVPTQTINNGLKPWGLIYDLLKNDHVPVNWIISPTKVKDGPDFSYNGVNYGGGSFIVDARFITPAVAAKFISYGVTYVITNSALTVNVTYTLTSVPTWTLDLQNGKIAQPFFANAGIPSTAYNYKLPSTLGGCDDIFVMPHADPTWPEHGNIWNWVQQYKGSIWAGCHAVSVLENLYDPANPSHQMNFLANNVGAAGNALVPFGSHAGGSPPYIHQHPSSVAAQYIGTTDATQQNGSEQIYLPKLGGGWRSTTEIIAYDPTQANVPALSPGPAAAIAYGRAFGNSNYGWILYEASHSIDKAGPPSSVAAQRSFFAFSFRAVVDKVPVITSYSIPSPMEGGIAYPVSVTASSPVGNTLSYQWVSSCGGTFANATAASTTFTPDQVVDNTNCIVTCIVSDACGRSTFISKPVQIQPGPRPPVAIDDLLVIPTSCGTGTSGTVDVLGNDSDPDGNLSGTVTLLGTGSNGTFTNNGDGTITYTPNQNFEGTDQVDYQVCDLTSPTPLCDTGTLTVHVGDADVHGCFGNSFYGQSASGNADSVYTATSVTNPQNALGDPDGLKADLNNAADVLILGLSGTALVGDTIRISWAKTGGGGTVTMLVSTSSDNSTYTSTTPYSTASTTIAAVVYIVPGSISGANFIKIQTSGNVNVSVDAVQWGTYSCISKVPAAADNKVTTLEDVAVKIHVLSNDIDPEGLTLSLVSVSTDPLHGVVSVNADGTITYQPNNDFAGKDSFYYKVCNTQDFCSNAKVLVTIVEDNCAANSYKAIPTSSLLTTTYNAARDNFLSQEKPGDENGTKNVMEVGKKPNKTRRGIIYFNLASPATGSFVPANAVINSATLRLTRTGGDGNGGAYTGQNVSVYHLTESWNETQSNWTTRSTGPTVLWTTAGGTFNPGVEATTFVPNTNANYTWDIASLFGDWKTDTSTNKGIIVRGDEVNDKKIVFGARNAAAGKTPLLTVVYQIEGTCVTTPNRAPLANKDFATTNSSTAIDINVKANDHDVDPVFNVISVISIIGSPVNGTASVNGDGTIHFTPTSGFNGTATFQYKISDNGGPALSDTGLVEIEVTNAPPVAVDDVASTNSGTATTIPVSANDYDPEGTALTPPSVVTPPANGTAVVSGDDIIYTPIPGYTGTDSFTYQICEASADPCSPAALCDTATVVVTIINQPPVATPDNASTDACQGTTIHVLANDVDPEGGFLTVSILTQPPNGEAVVSAGDIIYTPDPGFTGPTDTFSYQVCDDGNPVLCDQTLVTITINASPVNNAPVALPDTGNTNASEPLYLDILTNDSDPDGNTIVASLSPGLLQPQHGTASINQFGLLEYIPNHGFSGTDSLEYQLCDTFSPPEDGCPTIPSLCDTTIVIITVDPPVCTIEITGTATNVTCNGDNDGSIDITVTGAQGPVTYLWSDASSDEDRSGLAPGDYSVTAIDSVGCQATDTFTITQPDVLDVTGIVSDVTITNGSDGSIDITVTGGTPAYTYLWSDGSTDEDRAGLTAGTYIVTVTDAHGCPATDTFTVNEPPCTISLSSTQTDLLCNGDASGSIDVTTTGAQGDVTYSWNDGATTEDRTGLAAGTYTVTATDEGNCPDTLTVTITEPDSLDIGGVVGDVSITGGSDGSIDVTVTGGTPDYTYLWNDGATTEDRTDLPAGTYTVTVTDAHGCAATDTFTVNEPICVCATPEIISVVTLPGDSVSVCWTSQECATEYILRYRWKAHQDWNTVTIPLTDTCYAFSLKGHPETIIEIAAVCEDGDTTDFSPPYDYIYDGPCAVPVNLSTTNITSSSATLSWTPGTISRRQKVRYENLNTGVVVIKQVKASKTSLNISGLDASTNYRWKVEGDCWSPFLNFTTLTQTVLRNTDSSPADGFRELSVYPNPSSGELYVDLLMYDNTEDCKVIIQIINMIGQIVITQSTEVVDGHLLYKLAYGKDVSDGFYILKINSGDESAEQTIVISNDNK